jgi:DNA-binding NtrC family response regulator
MKSSPAKVLVFEADGGIRALLEKSFPRGTLAVDSLTARDEAWEPQPSRYDLLIWDAALSQADDRRTVERLCKNMDGCRLVVVVDRESKPSDLSGWGPAQVIRRPLEAEKLFTLVDRILKRKEPSADSVETADPIPLEFETMLGISLPMREVFQRILEAASADIAVLITGETGTGKDLVAAAIHKRSRRRDGPYGVTARPYSVPPGTPPDRLETLQKAFMQTARDPELLSEAKKAKLEFKPIDGPTIAGMFARLYDMNADMKARLKEIVIPSK